MYPDILPEEEGCGGPVLDAELLRILGLVHLAHLMDPSCFPLDMSGGNGPCVDAGTTKKGEAPEPTTLEIEAEVSSGLFGMVLVRQQKQLQRGYTLDSVVDWSEVLSGGEKQRLSLAR